MDAQSLHKHIESSTKQRIHAKTGDQEKDFDKKDSTQVDFNQEEIDHSANDVPEESKNDDQLGDTVNTENTKDTEDAKDLEEKQEIEKSSNDNEIEATNDSSSQAEILTMHEEEKSVGFNAFSSRHASAPMPRQNSQSPIEEAKPVKDNANAIVMILLITVLAIAVAVFCIIVLGNNSKTGQKQVSSQASTTIEDGADEEPSTTKQPIYDYSAIVGQWNDPNDETGPCITISEAGSVSWNKKCGNNNDDHFSGEAEFINGQDVVSDLGITKKQAARILGVNEEKLNLNNTFIVKVHPDKYYINNNSSYSPSEVKLLITKTSAFEIKIYDYRYGSLASFMVPLNEEND